MNEAKIFLHFALSEKNEDERLQKVIKACKIIADIMPNDSINESVKASIPEILPKLIKMLPYLTTSIDMLLKAFIERFAIDTESISQFYKIFIEEFQSAAHNVIKDKCIDYMFKILRRLDKPLLISIQNSLETVLKSNYFIQDNNRDKAIEIAEYLMECLDDDEINPYIYQEFLGYNNTVDNVLSGNAMVDKKKTIRANSIISESGFGDSFISEFQNEAADMNLNFDDFKSALKTESKIDRIEAFMNSEDIFISTNKNIRGFLNKKDNLEVFVSLISRPHEVESRIWWKPSQRISLDSREIFDDYREFNLRNQNNYYLYDHKSLNKIDYINKNSELKNIYRSFNALQIFLAKDNLEIILDRFEGSLEKIILSLKDAFDPKSNANIEHCLILMRALISERPDESLELLIQTKKIILLMLQMIENRFVYSFFNQLLLRPQTLMIDLEIYNEFVLRELMECKFFEILIELTTLSNAKLETTIFEFILDKEKKLQQEKEKLEKEKQHEEEEAMMKSQSMMRDSSVQMQQQTPTFFMFSQILQQPGSKDAKNKQDSQKEDMSSTQNEITKDMNKDSQQQPKIPFTTAVKAFQILSDLLREHIEVIDDRNCFDFHKYQSEELVSHLFGREMSPTLLQSMFTMCMKIFCLTDGHTKTYNWFINEQTKKVSKNSSSMRTSSANVGGPQTLWGVSKVEVADYGSDITELLINILKTYQKSDSLRYLVKGELLKLIKLNFVEFQKYLLVAFKEQPNPKILPKIAPMKYQTYDIMNPFSRRKIQMIEFLLQVVNFDSTFLLYLSKDAWSQIVDHVFQHEYCPVYHQTFFKLLLKVMELRDENLLVTVIVCQNALSKIHQLYEEQYRAIEYKMDFKKQDLMTIVCLWVELVDMHFDKNDNFPGFSSQLDSSYSWKRIKALKQTVKIHDFVGILEKFYQFPYLTQTAMRGMPKFDHQDSAGTLFADDAHSNASMDGTTKFHKSRVANVNGEFVNTMKSNGVLSPRSGRNANGGQGLNKKTSFGGAIIMENPFQQKSQVPSKNEVQTPQSRQGIITSGSSRKLETKQNSGQQIGVSFKPNQPSSTNGSKATLPMISTANSKKKTK
ncbi:UNKNOWN [Stylonychia lemnae]|uniref:Uncharacterized protein n=1 Tax=Stylonychia lemnae TaxID=5949 RepID=A0A078AJM9_STYLE|nr:UNKNOWN [Stylonychia lemnae]|eukprot:CDW82096.1 UNKNOWN [Stylonychia lemnae]